MPLGLFTLRSFALSSLDSKRRLWVTTRLGITFILAAMVVASSPIMFIENSAIASAPSTPLPTINTISSVPSTIGQDGKDGDFTTQATLGSLTARPTNNIVNTKSFYDIVFVTTTSGAIKTIQVTFPAGTTIPSSAFFNEAEGVGPGTVTKSGQTLTFTVTNAINVPAGTKVRLEFANINNPLNPSSSLKVTITTRNAGNAIIDGPTQSTAYSVKQIGSNAIASNAVTTSKIDDNAITTDKLAPGSVNTDDIANQAITSAAIATSFAYQREVADGVNGWDPNSATTSFFVDDSLITSTDQRILVNLDQPGGPVCSGIMAELNVIEIDCTSDPADGTTLRYAVFSPATP